jgi:hypothetical protein
MLAQGLGNRLENLPELRLLVKRTESVGGMVAARVEAVAPGTGDSLVPSGMGAPLVPEGKTLIPTRQITLGFTHPRETIYLTWHVPESSLERIQPEIAATLASLRFSAAGSP